MFICHNKNRFDSIFFSSWCYIKLFTNIYEITITFWNYFYNWIKRSRLLSKEETINYIIGFDSELWRRLKRFLSYFLSKLTYSYNLLNTSYPDFMLELHKQSCKIIVVYHAFYGRDNPPFISCCWSIKLTIVLFTFYFIKSCLYWWLYSKI